MWQDAQNPYAQAAQSPYYAQPTPHAQTAQPLQFYAPSPGPSDGGGYYPGSRSSLEGNMGVQGSMGVGGVSPGFGGNIQQVGPWWTAFGTGGLEGEPPLLEGECVYVSCGDNSS